MIDEWKDSVNAIIMAYYPGMEGGTALGEIIYGDVNPSGKPPFVIPKKESDLPQVDWDAEHQYYEYFHGYRKLEKEGIEPEVPFGFGLSYTSFTTDKIKAWVTDDVLYACCELKNTGNREGGEVLQLYVGFEQSKVERPVKTLKGFKRVHLQQSEKRQVIVSCHISELAWFNEEKNAFEVEHMEYEVYLGTSSAVKDLLKTTITI